MSDEVTLDEVRQVCVETFADGGRVFDDLLRGVRAAAWHEGALWSAGECGAIRDEHGLYLTPGDNPYEEDDGSDS